MFFERTLSCGTPEAVLPVPRPRGRRFLIACPSPPLAPMRAMTRVPCGPLPRDRFDLFLAFRQNPPHTARTYPQTRRCGLPGRAFGRGFGQEAACVGFAPEKRRSGIARTWFGTEARAACQGSSPHRRPSRKVSRAFHARRRAPLCPFWIQGRRALRRTARNRSCSHGTAPGGPPGRPGPRSRTVWAAASPARALASDRQGRLQVMGEQNRNPGRQGTSPRDATAIQNPCRETGAGVWRSRRGIA